MTKVLKNRAKRRGANAVEFGLTLPVFLAVVLGMIDFGWYFSRVAIVNAAAGQSCRDGALIDTLVGDPTSVAEGGMASVLSAGGLGCALCEATISGNVPDKTLNCTVQVNSPPLTGFVPLPSMVVSTTSARLEWQRNN